MSIQTAAALCIIGSVLCLLLREYQKPQAALLSIAVAAGAVLSAMPEVRQIAETASALYAQSSLSPAYFVILCKALGIAYLTQLGSDICRDCGEAAIASAVELCGRISLVALALPLFVQLTKTVLGVIG